MCTWKFAKDLTSSQTGNDAMSSTYRAGFHTNVATGMSPKGQATSPRHQRRPAMALNAGLQDFPARHQGFVGKSLLPKTQQVAHGFPTKKRKNPGEFRVFNMIRIEKVRWNGIDLCEFFGGDIGWPIRPTFQEQQAIYLVTLK